MREGSHSLNHVQPVRVEAYSLMIPVIGAMAPVVEKVIEVFKPVFLLVSKTEPRSVSKARVVPVNGVDLAVIFLSKSP